MIVVETRATAGVENNDAKARDDRPEERDVFMDAWLHGLFREEELVMVEDCLAGLGVPFLSS